jgi:manganese transport protein
VKHGKLSSIILWSVISAAFIGPGTITTAVAAGSRYQIDLLWAIAFSIVACMAIQEMAARISIASGLSLGDAFALKFGGRIGRIFRYVTGWTVIAGCAAFEAGNFTGAVSGIRILIDIEPALLAVILSSLALLILFLRKAYWISGTMLVLVAIMGIAFAFLAIETDHTFTDVAGAVFLPSAPSGSDLIVVGLIGTTIVPYNLFLSSRISRDQSLPLMRLGLIVSVFIGGVITASVLIAGAAINDFNSFSDLGAGFKHELGEGGVIAFSLGLFAAGFSSSVTAPYAASVIGSSVLALTKAKGTFVWILVVVIGFVFSVAGFQPVQLILAVQALNGIILPVVTFFLLLILNDGRIVPRLHKPHLLYNIFLAIVLIVITAISVNSIIKSSAMLL